MMWHRGCDVLRNDVTIHAHHNSKNEANIENSALLEGKEIKYKPGKDQLILWFLRTYSTQPGFREDNQNVDKIVAALTQYFRQNPTKKNIEVDQAFIKGILPTPSAFHQRKQELRALRLEARKEMDAERAKFESACDKKGKIVNQTLANEALSGLIANKSLMRRYTKDLIGVLNQDLAANRDNKALLEPEIIALEKELKNYRQFTPEQIEFLSNNIERLKDYDLKVSSLSELVDERLKELTGLVDYAESEVVRFAKKAGPLENAQDKLNEYVKEQEALVRLKGKLNPNASAEQEAPSEKVAPASPSLPTEMDRRIAELEEKLRAISEKLGNPAAANAEAISLEALKLQNVQLQAELARLKAEKDAARQLSPSGSQLPPPMLTSKSGAQLDDTARKPTLTFEPQGPYKGVTYGFNVVQ